MLCKILQNRWTHSKTPHKVSVCNGSTNTVKTSNFMEEVMTLPALVRHPTTILYALVISPFLATSVHATNVFINEFHYDNDGPDINEGIEIAGPNGTDLTDWSLVLYNSTNGSPYNTIDLNGIIPDQSNGLGTVFFAVTSMQNGAADGIALVDNTNLVRQFISYEGDLIASSGPASGQSSEDIGIAEATTTALGLSLQLTGSRKRSIVTRLPITAPAPCGVVEVPVSYDIKTLCS